MACNFCKRLTVSATSPTHFISRLGDFLELENQSYVLPQSHFYHTSAALTLTILERTPIEYLSLSNLLHQCDGRTSFTPFPVTDDERYLFKRQLKQEGLTVIDALVQPLQARVEAIRKGGDFRLRA